MLPPSSGQRALPPSTTSKLSTAWVKRVNDLAARARSGAAWAPRMAARLGTNDAGAAAARWIGIESGGDPRNVSTLGERGLAQIMERSLPGLGMTRAEFDAMISPRTTDDQHADMAAKIIRNTVLKADKAGMRAPDWGPGVNADVRAHNILTVNGIGVGKLQHGLPLLLKELNEQGLLQTSLLGTLVAMAARYKPSELVASFGRGKHAVTGVPRHDLLLRFLAPAAVVAFAEGAANFAPALETGVS